MLSAIPPRQKRIGLNAAILLIGIIIVTLSGVSGAKYYASKDNNLSPLTIFTLGVPLSFMILLCALEILMHFVGPKTGIHRKTALGVFCFCLLGVVCGSVFAIVTRSISNYNDEYFNLGIYRAGDEFFWPAWSLSVVQCFCHGALIGAIGFKSSRFMPPVYMSAVDASKMPARSTV